jgi:hypothetical protein
MCIDDALSPNKSSILTRMYEHGSEQDDPDSHIPVEIIERIDLLNINFSLRVHRQQKDLDRELS